MALNDKFDLSGKRLDDEDARAEPEAAERVRSLATSPEWEAQMRRRLRGIVEKHVKEV